MKKLEFDFSIPGSIVKDVCNCCDACAKQVGEKCGGLWKHRCDQGLICKGLTHKMEYGKCIKSTFSMPGY